jgi:nicotinate-nucleotide--dimethylbenzimidazole phosphoribosyltransferase
MSIAVGGLTLVEATVLALPFDSLRALGTRLESVASVALPALPSSSQAESAPSPRQTATSTESTRRPIAEEEPPVTPAADLGAPPASAPEPAVDSTEPRTTADRGADSAATPEPSAVIADVPSQLPHAAVDDDQSVWSVAADGGTAIGRKSKEAGVAAAGFFTRVARRVAGSF